MPNNESNKYIQGLGRGGVEGAPWGKGTEYIYGAVGVEDEVPSKEFSDQGGDEVWDWDCPCTLADV